MLQANLHHLLRKEQVENLNIFGLNAALKFLVRGIKSPD